MNIGLRSIRTGVRLSTAVIAASLLAACATEFSGSAPVAASASAGGSRIADVAGPGYADLTSVRRALDELLSRNIDADAAVRIALLASPAMHRIYFDLRLAGDDIARAATAAAPPSESVEYWFASSAIGSRRRSASEAKTLKFEQAKLEMAGEIVRLGLEVRRAH